MQYNNKDIKLIYSIKTTLNFEKIIVLLCIVLEYFKFSMHFL